MTDLEMDLFIAKARISTLERELEEARKKIPKKCSFGEGITFKPDGVHELDACIYETMEVHENVTVEVLCCQKCGHIEIQWKRQDGDQDG